MGTANHETTTLLERMPQVYFDLRRITAPRIRAENIGHTLQASART